MNSLLSSTQIARAPEPRPVVVAPSLAAQEPVTGTKPAPPRHHQLDERPGRAHVQRGLHHVVRGLRSAIKTEVKAGVR